MTATRAYPLILPNERCDAKLDPAALVENFGALLFRVAYSILRSRPEAEDVVQDVFVRVLERHSTWSDVRDLRVWLVRIAWNLALDRKRRIRPDQLDTDVALSLAARTVPADQAVDEVRRVQALMEGLERLPKAERQALLLSGVEELSTAEVAVVMGRSESATRALIFRARARLRKRLDVQKGGQKR